MASQESSRDRPARPAPYGSTYSRYDVERLETIDEHPDLNINIPRRRGKRHIGVKGTASNPVTDPSHLRLPRAIYRNGRLEDYDFEAGGSGPWSIDEVDSPAATFGGRATQEGHRRLRHSSSYGQRSRRASAQDRDPEPFTSANQGRRMIRNPTGNTPNAGPSRVPQPQYRNPQTAHLEPANEITWLRVQDGYWKLVLYGCIERIVGLVIEPDFDPPVEEIMKLTRRYWTLAFQRGIAGFHIPRWARAEARREFSYGATSQVAPGYTLSPFGALPGVRDPRSPRSPW